MKKYKTEGNIDFFNELYKSLDEKEDTFKTEEDEDKCLITNQPLTDKFVKLDCGHKFNYIPLFNDIKNHKAKFNSMEGQSTLLKQNEIRCPYCRKRQTSVLPFYEDLLIEKINGVNYYDTNASNLGCIYSQNGCQYKFVYKYNDGTTKEFTCFQKNVYNFEDGKQYCFHHHDIMNKNLLKKQNLKIKEDIKKAKIEELNKLKEEKNKAKEELNKAKEQLNKSKEEKKILKEELKKVKEDLKQVKEVKKKIKEEKQQIKLLQKPQPNPQIPIIPNLESEENIIIEPSTQLCCIVLKNGNQCSMKSHLENLCKRHYNLKNKGTNEIIEK